MTTLRPWAWPDGGARRAPSGSVLADTRRPRRDGVASRAAGRATRAGHGAGAAARLAAAAAWAGPGPGPGEHPAGRGPRGSRAARASRALRPGARTSGTVPVRARGRAGGVRGGGASGRGEAGTHRGRRGVPGRAPTSLLAGPAQEGPSQWPAGKEGSCGWDDPSSPKVPPVPCCGSVLPSSPP